MNKDPGPVTVLSGLEAVRHRPAMYIGDTSDGTGLYRMLWELLDNGVDAHLEGNASLLRVGFHDDGGVSVEDDGRGIPISLQAREPGKRTLQEVMTLLGGVSPWRSPSAPAVRPWGPGIAVVNALSSRLEVEICRDGRRHVQEYAAGVAMGPVRDLGPSGKTGTRFRFTPDFSLLRRRPWDRAMVARRLREISAMSPGLTTMLDDRAFRCPDGLADHVRFLGRRQRPLHDEPVRLCGLRRDVGVEVALLWTEGARRHTRGFVGHARVRRGTHLRGLTRGLFAAFVDLDPTRFRTAHRDTVREVLRTGLVAAVHVTPASPQFGSAMRDRLENPEVLTAVAGIVAEQLAERLRSDRPLRGALLARMPG